MTEKEGLGSPLAITMGCPAGVGPEIILKALARPEEVAPVVVIGDMNILRRAKGLTGLEDMEFKKWNPGDKVQPGKTRSTVYVYPATDLLAEEAPPGKPTAVTGNVSFTYLQTAIDLCLERQASGIVTAPISKTGLKLAGYTYPGHTEILAEKTGTEDFLMMMAGRDLNVTLVTIHVPLAQVPSLLTRERVLKTIEITALALKRDFGIQQPRVAVCGLNPHAGEDGMFGTEEIEIIGPACRAAREKGLNITGPLPPDTVFYQAVGGDFDAVVCQYHDQGLIPFKLLHFRDGVNITLGLPVVRTSVDHGTAYDIAGTGRADSGSIEAAIRLAAEIASNRARHSSS